ncbi:MAG: disulfide bond formation protein B [Thiotrichales bacterium]
MNLNSRRSAWLAVGLGAAALASGSVVLTILLDLSPCHLCIFQRLLFMALAVSALLAAALSLAAGRVAGFASLLVIITGFGTAAFQTWLEMQPPGTASCVGGDPSAIERLVEWLGERMPGLFLATGFCDEPELRILGLTLANASLMAFTTFFLLALWALFLKPNPRDHA